MKKLYACFPLSAKVRPDHPKTLIKSVVIYLIICAILSLLQLITVWIPLVGWITDVFCALLGLYCIGGIVLSVLSYGV